MTGTSGKHQIRTFRPDGSEERTLVETDDRIYSGRWSPAGDSIYYLHGKGSTKEVSNVSVVRGDDKVVAGGLQTGRFFTLSGDGSRLAYTREDRHWNLWRIDLPAAGRRAQPEISRLTSGTSSYGKPNLLTDAGSSSLRSAQPSRRTSSKCRAPMANPSNSPFSSTPGLQSGVVARRPAHRVCQ